jgi:hypothetical protein
MGFKARKAKQGKPSNRMIVDMSLPFKQVALLVQHTDHDSDNGGSSSNGQRHTTTVGRRRHVERRIKTATL